MSYPSFQRIFSRIIHHTHRSTPVAVLALSFITAGAAQTQPIANPQTSDSRSGNPAQGPKKRIAVLDFDYSTVHDQVSAVFGADRDIGKGIADLLVNDLVSSGRVSVIERKAIDKVLAEQNFSNSDRADAASAAKLGRVMGVDAIILGSVTQFGRDDKTTNLSGIAGAGAVVGMMARKTLIGGLASRYVLGGVGQRQAKAIVGISARVVSTATGEVLAVASGKGESSRSGTNLLAAAGQVAGGSGQYDVSSKNFGETILGEALTQAVADLTTKLEREGQRLPDKAPVEASGLVADVASGGTLVMNVGSKAGIKTGDHLRIKRSTREIKDPTTGKVIRRIEDQIGDVVVTEVDEQSSVGKFTGAVAPVVGDSVRMAP